MTLQRDAQEAWEGVAQSRRDQREAERLEALRLEAQRAARGASFEAFARTHLFTDHDNTTDTEGTES